MEIADIFFLDAAGGDFLAVTGVFFLAGIFVYSLLKSGLMVVFHFSGFKETILPSLAGNILVLSSGLFLAIAQFGFLFWILPPAFALLADSFIFYRMRGERKFIQFFAVILGVNLPGMVAWFIISYSYGRFF